MNFYDIDYVTNLRSLARKYLNSSKVVLFSVDGCSNEDLRNGKIPGKEQSEYRSWFSIKSKCIYVLAKG